MCGFNFILLFCSLLLFCFVTVTYINYMQGQNKQFEDAKLLGNL